MYILYSALCMGSLQEIAFYLLTYLLIRPTLYKFITDRDVQ